MHVCYFIIIIINRYAVKLLYDEAAIGEASDNEELFSDYLSNYDTDWHIGNEDDGEWADAVLSQKPHLFSMDYDQETVSEISKFTCMHVIELIFNNCSPIFIAFSYPSVAHGL